MKIQIEKENGFWVVRKGKKVLAVNYRTNKPKWSSESKLGIDDIDGWETLNEVEELLELVDSF